MSHPTAVKQQVITGSADLDIVLEYAPEWEQLLRNFRADTGHTTCDFFNRVGAKAIFYKALSLKDQRKQFIELLQAHYYQPMLSKMLGSNQSLKRFLGQRHVAIDEQRRQVTSLSADLAQKLSTTLTKHLAADQDDGFKVLLPAYVQRSVHNSVVDYIRQESSWERQTLQDMYLDPQQDDPRSSVADDVAYTPEHKAISQEQASQLNQLRTKLESLLHDGHTAKEPLVVVDCIFGLGLTPDSTIGEEMTMRECCDKLNLQGDTTARRIARCQVLLDKGLELIRQKIYEDMPGIVESWQRGLNINTASRRELAQQLSMTEGEIDRCIKGRQFSCLDDLVDRQVIKAQRLPEVVRKGAVAAFVPVDLNAATNRDIMDIIGVSKESAAKIVAERPFKDLEELVKRKLVTKQDLELYIQRGAVVRAKFADSKRLDLNRVPLEEILPLGLDSAIARLIVQSRPFLTWAEVEEFVGADSPGWATLRQKFYLGISSG